MAAPNQERDVQIIYTTRSHPKALIYPGIIQVVFLALHYFIITRLPLVINNDIDKWTNIAVHLTVGILELKYATLPLLRWYFETFEITKQRVNTHEGLLNRTHQEVKVSNVAQIVVERDIIDRFFGCGTIRLYDATNTLGLVFKDVPHVKKVKDLIDEQRGL